MAQYEMCYMLWVKKNLSYMKNNHDSENWTISLKLTFNLIALWSDNDKIKNNKLNKMKFHNIVININGKIN
jgi:hypothetical protein